MKADKKKHEPNPLLSELYRHVIPSVVPICRNNSHRRTRQRCCKKSATGPPNSDFSSLASPASIWANMRPTCKSGWMRVITAAWSIWRATAASARDHRNWCRAPCGSSHCAWTTWTGTRRRWRCWQRREKAYISRYTLGRDYHKLMRKRLSQLADRIEAEVGGGQYRAFVDSAPVLERAVAERAGLGWIAKNTMLINADAGSWFFLGEIFTDLPLPVDQPHTSKHCGTCTACLDICPTARLHRALPTGCPQVHFLSHHRAPRQHRSRPAAADGQPHLRL